MHLELGRCLAAKPIAGLGQINLLAVYAALMTCPPIASRPAELPLERLAVEFDIT